MRVRITAVEADNLIEAIQSDLQAVAIDWPLAGVAHPPRVRYDIGSIIRETVLAFEESRMAAARKTMPARRKRAAKKTVEPAANAQV